MNKSILRGSTVVLSSSLLGAVLPSGVSSAFPWETALSSIYLPVTLFNSFRNCCSRRTNKNSIKIAENEDSDLKYMFRSFSSEKEKVKKLLEDSKKRLDEDVSFKEFFDLSYDDRENVYKGKLKFLGKKMFDVKLSLLAVPRGLLLKYEVIFEMGKNFKVKVDGSSETFIVNLCNTLKSIKNLISTRKFMWCVENFEGGNGDNNAHIWLTPIEGFTVKSGRRAMEKIDFVLKDNIFGRVLFGYPSKRYRYLRECGPFMKETDLVVRFFKKIKEGIEKSNGSNNIVNLDDNVLPDYDRLPRY